MSSPLTWRDSLQTDIPQDFEIPLRGVVVNIPAGAKFLFVGVVDRLSEDNIDSDGNYGLHLSPFEPRFSHSGHGSWIEWDAGLLESRRAFDFQPWQQVPNSTGRLSSALMKGCRGGRPGINGDEVRFGPTTGGRGDREDLDPVAQVGLGVRI